MNCGTVLHSLWGRSREQATTDRKMLICTQTTLCSNCRVLHLYVPILFSNDFSRIYLNRLIKPFDSLVLLRLTFTRVVKRRTSHKIHSKAIRLWGLPYSTWSVSPLVLEPETCNSIPCTFSQIRVTEELLQGWCAYESFYYLQQAQLYSYLDNELLLFTGIISTSGWTHSTLNTSGFIFIFPYKYYKKLIQRALAPNTTF